MARLTWMLVGTAVTLATAPMACLIVGDNTSGVGSFHTGSGTGNGSGNGGSTGGTPDDCNPVTTPAVRRAGRRATWTPRAAASSASRRAELRRGVRHVRRDDDVCTAQLTCVVNNGSTSGSCYRFCCTDGDCGGGGSCDIALGSTGSHADEPGRQGRPLRHGYRACVRDGEPGVRRHVRRRLLLLLRRQGRRVRWAPLRRERRRRHRRRQRHRRWQRDRRRAAQGWRQRHRRRRHRRRPAQGWRGRHRWWSRGRRRRRADRARDRASSCRGPGLRLARGVYSTGARGKSGARSATSSMAIIAASTTVLFPRAPDDLHADREPDALRDRPRRRASRGDRAAGRASSRRRGRA